MKRKYLMMLSLVFATLGLFSIVLGSSYALFTTTVTTKDYAIYTGNLKVDFEGNTNVMNLEHEYPKTNEEGLASEGYSFNITNNGSVNAKYQIRLDTDLADAGNMILNYLKVALIRNDGSDEVIGPFLVSNLNEAFVLLKNQSLQIGQTDSYTLKLWLDYSTPLEARKYFAYVRVVVDSVQDTADNYVYNDSKPFIKIKGAAGINLLKGEEFIDPGVLSVKDDKDILTPDDVVVSYYDGAAGIEIGTIDTNVVGYYVLVYTVTDSDNNQSKEARIVMVNNTPTIPTISLLGKSDLTISKGSTYIESGATVASGNTLVISGEVDTSKEGIYFIKYIVVDKDGNTNVKLRKVTVVERELSTFDTDSWETIVANIRSGNASKYAPVAGGQEAQVLRPVTLTYTSNGKEVQKTYNLRVANTTSCEDALLENPSLTSETACGFVVEFADVIANQVSYTNATGAEGYPGSLILTKAEEIFSQLPAELQEIIIDTTVVTGHNNTSTENTTLYNQKLYSLDRQEVSGDNSKYNSAYTLTRQLDYYALNNENKYRIKSSSSWWLRSMSSNGTYYDAVHSGGSLQNRRYNTTAYTSFAFRIG